MAIALVQSATGRSTTATTTAAFSTAPTSGNLVVLAFSSDQYNGTPDTGWTQSAEMEQQTFHGGYVWWRISNGSNSLQYTIGAAANSSWVLMEFSGVDPTPYDISEGQFQQTSTSSYTSANITPSTGDRLLVACFGGSHGAADLSGAYTTWSNSFTAIANIGQTAGPATCMGTAYRLVTGDGSTAFSTGVNYPTTVQSKSAMVIAFKAAAAGGTTTPKTVNATASASVSAVKQGRKVVAASLADTVAVGKGIARSLAVTATTAVVAAATRAFLKTVAVAAAASVSLQRQTGKRLAPLATGTVSVAKSIGKRVSASCSAAVAAVKRAGKALSASAVSAASLAAIFARTVTINAAVGSSVTIRRAMTRTIAVTATGTVTATKAIAFTLAVSALTLVAIARSIGGVVVDAIRKRSRRSTSAVADSTRPDNTQDETRHGTQAHNVRRGNPG